MTESRKTLNRLFDDAIDELEVTYDVYFDIERYRLRCVHILNTLLSNGISNGKVLVMGPNEEPFAMCCAKLGFEVADPGVEHLTAGDAGSATSQMFSAIELIGNLKDNYDVIICDDMLQYFASPSTILAVMKDHLKAGGMLTMTTPNIARGITRLRLLTGRNVYPWPMNDVPDGESKEHEVPRSISYREYTLQELNTLVRNSGFELIRSEFIIGKKINASAWPPVPVKEYLFQTLYYGIQKMAAPLRSYLFIAARKPLLEEAEKRQEEAK